jgi:hypothetical protein
MVFGDGGYGGWSCPTGKVVLGGGFDALDTVAVSAPGTPGSVWPHYTFGPSEYGWVIRDDPNGAGNTITIYAICANVQVEAAGAANGGGQVPVAGGRASFGFNARNEDGVASGHLNYKNHASGAHLNCTVDVFTELTPTTAKFEGTCSPNSAASSFSAEVEDNGEPGKGKDKFEITYGANTEGGTLTAGNIQIRSEPAAAATAVTGAGESTSQGGTFNGVSVSGLELGTGVSIAPSGVATGQLLAVLHGTSALGLPREIEVDGKVGAGSVGLDGSATLSGVATVDMGDGVVLRSVPLTATATAGSVLLTLGTSTLPSATLTAGSITIE